MGAALPDIARLNVAPPRIALLAPCLAVPYGTRLDRTIPDRTCSLPYLAKPDFATGDPALPNLSLT